jgi:hypothetical protein
MGSILCKTENLSIDQLKTSDSIHDHYGSPSFVTKNEADWNKKRLGLNLKIRCNSPRAII